jgi:MFS family permease
MARREKLFYGWVIVAVMAATSAASMAMGTLNFGLFVKPMGEELGIGRAVFGWAQTARQVTSALTSPLVGALIDRFGSRLLLAGAALITGSALAGLGVITAGWQLVALFGLMGLVGMSGPGALVTTVPVAKWFVRQRGRAMAFASLGFPLGAVVFIPLTQVLIERYGWRGAWFILAVTGAGIIVPLSLAFVRRAPEDLGLAPDGAPPKDPGDATEAADPPFAPHGPEEQAWTPREAMRTASFWQLTLAFSIVMLAVSSVGIHRIPHFMDRGLDPRLVSYATALDAVASGVSMFVMGMLAQRLPSRFLGAAGFALLAVATALTTLARSAPAMFLAMATFGAGIGGLFLLQNYVWADYFGRAHLGRIRGVVTPVTLAFSGIGAPLSGYVRDASGTYTGMWLAGIALCLLGAGLLALSPPPRRLPGEPHPREALGCQA